MQIINLSDFKKAKKLEYFKQKIRNLKSRLIAILVILVALSAIIGNYFYENPLLPDFAIPPSPNITYNLNKISSITPQEIVDEIKISRGQPILLHLYTVWCSICKKQLPIINEITRQFQGTDLKVITLAIDRDISETKLLDYLYYYGNIYFVPLYLLYPNEFQELLAEQNIIFDGRIPLTVIIGRDGEILAHFSGEKSEKFIKNKILGELKLALLQ